MMFQYFSLSLFLKIPGGSDGKESAYNGGDLGSIRGREEPLEKEISNHSSVLVWRNLWAMESGRLQFMGLQRVAQKCAQHLAQKCVHRRKGLNTDLLNL